MSIREKVKQIIADFAGRETVEDSDTFSDLNIDSLEAVEVLLECEKALNVDIDIDAEPTTVGEMCGEFERVLR